LNQKNSSEEKNEVHKEVKRVMIESQRVKLAAEGTRMIGVARAKRVNSKSDKSEASVCR